MNYSEYFENKVAAVLSNQFSLTIVKTKATTQLDFISEIKLLSSMEEVWAVINLIEPYNIFMVNNDITVKVMDYGQEKVQ